MRGLTNEIDHECEMPATCYEPLSLAISLSLLHIDSLSHSLSLSLVVSLTHSLGLPPSRDGSLSLFFSSSRRSWRSLVSF